MSPFLSTISALVSSDNADLSARQLAVLGICVEDPDGVYGPRELAPRLNVSKPVITRAADRLTDLGFMKRAGLGDRRLVRLVPTPAGRKFWASTQKAA